MTELAQHGDPTTTGGKLFARDVGQTNDGIPLLLDRDKATCGNCEGIWEVVGSCASMTFDGRKAVQHGDPITCPCGKNRVIATSANMHYDHLGSGSGHAASRTANALGSNLMAAAFDRVFVLKNNQTGAPLPYMRYRLTLLDGTTADGITNGQGITKAIVASRQHDVRIEVSP